MFTKIKPIKLITLTKFKEVFPELIKLTQDEIERRFEEELDIYLYTEEEKPVPFWIRLTFPFAILVIICLYLFLPINFIFTGKWGYALNGTKIHNWFRMLKFIV